VPNTITELLLGGQCVLPCKALASRFVFRQETLLGAFSAMPGLPTPLSASQTSDRASIDEVATTAAG
jgi:hypothetical protein